MPASIESKMSAPARIFTLVFKLSGWLVDAFLWPLCLVAAHWGIRAARKMKSEPSN